MQGVSTDPDPDTPGTCNQVPCLGQRAAAIAGQCREWVAENHPGWRYELREAPSPQHMLHCSITLHTKHRFKDITIKNFKTAGSRRASSPAFKAPFWVRGPVWLHLSDAQDAGPGWDLEPEISTLRLRVVGHPKISGDEKSKETSFHRSVEKLLHTQKHQAPLASHRILPNN